MQLPRLLSTLGLAAVLACGGGPDLAPRSARSSELDVPNGDNLNGDNLNGDNLNGSSFGTHVAQVGYAAWNRGPIFGVHIQGSQLVGYRAGSRIAGAAFAGAYFAGTSDTGAQVALHVSSVAQAAAPDDDVWLYSVQYFSPGSDAWRPLCADASGAARPAIAVAGRWSYAFGSPGGGGKIADPNAFTFACQGLGAIGKCISPIGYKPWASKNGVPLDRFHQACVRLIRADFCGDGTSYTVDGQHVNVYDAVGVQQDSELWLIEAEWDEHGARCFSPLNRSHAFVPCFPLRALDVCGDPLDFLTGTLLMDETPPLSNVPPL